MTDQILHQPEKIWARGILISGCAQNGLPNDIYEAEAHLTMAQRKAGLQAETPLHSDNRSSQAKEALVR